MDAQSQPQQPGKFKSIGGLITLWVTGLLCSSAWSQSASLPAPTQMITPSERLLMEQVAQLVGAGEYTEALIGLQKLYDQGAGSLVPAGSIEQHATLLSQRYVPLRQWSQAKTRELLLQQSRLAEQYHQQVDGPAQAAFLSLQSSQDPLEAKRVARRYSLSGSGRDLGLLLSDLHLERGWTLAALAEIERATPELSFQPAADAEGGQLSNATWMSAWARADDGQSRQQLLLAWKNAYESKSTTGIGSESLLEALKRMLLAAAMEPKLMDRTTIIDWASTVAAELPAAQQARLLSCIRESEQWPALGGAPRWKNFAGNDARSGEGHGKYDLSAWPEWQLQVEGFSTANDRTNASRPRVGETERHALPYHSVIADGKVFVHELNRIQAFDLGTGKPWPEVEPPLPLFDSHTATASYLPLGYPLVGVARGTLTIADGCLYARMGSPVTGWANREKASDGSSLSYLVGLDLHKQGSLLRGYPLHLREPEFSDTEFEGCPLVCGELLMVAVVERDNVGLRRSVVAFDRLDGRLVWRSPVLAEGTVDGSDRANLITHQLLTYAGGRLYYNTNLGSIVCLDPLTGETEWLVRYARHDQRKRGHPTPDRFRYRDLTPCLVAKGIVFCLPQDCGELFAIDAANGNLLWSTDDSLVSDAIHLLGIVGDNLIVSGDRLVWLDCYRGQVIARFPASTTPGIVNALPSPRGLGRGAIIDSEVYWPTAAEVFIFDGQFAKPAGIVESPPIKRRFHIGSRGSSGGNLCTAADHLIFCGANRIMAFRSLPVPGSSISQH